jgi:hypothetical protein
MTHLGSGLGIAGVKIMLVVGGSPVPDCVRGEVKADTVLFHLGGEQLLIVSNFEQSRLSRTDYILIAIRMNSAPSEMSVTTAGPFPANTCDQRRRRIAVAARY